MKNIITFILFIHTFILANSLKINNKDLSTDKTWLALLHYNIGESKSDILTTDFFLSSVGNVNPKEELRVTIEAYEKNKTKIICKYPARYLWLAEQLEWKDYQKRISQCHHYNNWNLIQGVKSIGLVFVSGFLGNPASAFGHSFIKINKSDLNKNILLDNTISYGAKLPKSYSMLSYIFNGLTGGYTGAYTDQYYYMNDMAYSNQEFRDMWEYRLTMSQAKKELFLSHLWELRGVEFQYFFLNRNCGYKVSELLDIVNDENIRDRARIWYAPVETFYRMEELSDKPKKISYHPSKQLEIYAFYRSLNKKEKEEVIAFVQARKKHTDLNKLSLKEIDFLLDYYTYVLESMEKSDVAYTKMKKTKLILLKERIKMPIRNYEKPFPEVKRPITENNAPMRLKAGAKVVKNGDSFLHMEFSPFAIDEVGYNLYGGDIFSIMNLGVNISQSDISFSSLDFVKIRRLKTQKLPFDIDNPLSWKLHIGMTKNNEWDSYIDVGAGYTWQVTSHIKLFSFLNLSTHTENPHYRVSPNIGIFADYNYFKFSYEFTKDYVGIHKFLKDSHKFNMGYNIDKKKAIFFQY
ncbi:MAG TPA: DUF4105 domain-containing protein, partial [Arcobacter sp.]|nr:DUF4105 domain-containing protein [Arcobacter sp.]